MPWTQHADDVWTFDDGATQGTVRHRDGSWWAEPQPPTSAGETFETPAHMSEGDFDAALAALPEPLGPFATADEAKSALEQATRPA